MARKRAKKVKNNYFSQETEDAIIEYNNSDNFEVKSKIYGERIHYPFFKLTQNIIHKFKFYYTDVENLEDLQHEIITFLLSKIHLYDHKNNLQSRITKIITKDYFEEYEGDFVKRYEKFDKVTQEQINDFISELEVSDECMDKLKKLTPPKAFSYFGTIVKRWLIVYNEKNYKSLKNVSSSEILEDNKVYSYDIDLNTPNTEYLDPKDRLPFFMDKFINYCTDNIYELFPKPSEAKIADAILELFRRRESIEIFNKKAFYLQIKETIDVKTSKITEISKQLKNIFSQNYIKYNNTGLINFPNPNIYNKHKSLKDEFR